MKKLKIILPFSLLFLIFLLFRDSYSSHIDVSNNYFEGIITNIKIIDDKVEMIVKNDENILVNYYINSSKERLNLKIGYKVKIEGTFNLPSINTNFYLFNYKNYLKSKKTYYILKANKIYLIKDKINIVYRVKQYIQNNTNHRYLKAFILGDTSLIDDNIKDSFQINGISHLLAVSGMHVSLLTGVLFYLLNKIFKNKRLSNILIIVFLLFYLFITGFMPSILRSVLMFIFLIVNKKYNFGYKNYVILLFVCALLLVYNPYFIYNSGFLYSFVISFFLIIYKAIIDKYNNYFIKIFVISIIAFIVSIPISISNNFSINLISPLLNVIFVPFISLIIFPLSLIAFLLPQLLLILDFVISIFEYLSLFFSDYSIEVILCSIPFYVILFYYLIIIIVLYKWKNNNMRFSFLLVITIFIHNNINYFNVYPYIVMIDVGQGDSILMVLPHNKGNILIDTGGKVLYSNDSYDKNSNYSIGESIIIPYLKANGIKNLDYLILTHGDYDHSGEAIKILNNYRVKKVILNSYSNNELEKEIIKEVENKNILLSYFNINTLKIDKYVFNFINKKHSNENDDSLIIYTTINNRNILLMGDASSKVESEILNEYNINNVDILKVGHHGSNTSSSEYFIKKIRPKIALISVSNTNKYNHPHKVVIDLLNKYNVKIYQTNLNGNVKIVLKNNIQISTAMLAR